MTSKEKAAELVKKYREIAHSTDCLDGEFFTNNTMWGNNAKQCALIAVDEMINELIWIHDERAIKIDYGKGIFGHEIIGIIYGQSEYWEQVKQEIEKL